MSRSLADQLNDWLNFEDCLVHDVRPIMFGYGLDLTINVVRENGRVRSDVFEAPRLVTVRMLGVDRISFDGGLTEAMKQEPEKIDWGLTEIAQIVPLAVPSGYGLSVEWESARRLDVVFAEFAIQPEAK